MGTTPIDRDIGAIIEEQMQLAKETDKLKPGDPGYYPYPKNDYDIENEEQHLNPTSIRSDQEIENPAAISQRETTSGQFGTAPEEIAAPPLNQPNLPPVNQYYHPSPPCHGDEAINAFTNRQKIVNDCRSESERAQKNNLKNNDSLQIQRIQDEFCFKQPIAITDNVSLKVKFPLHELPPEFQDFLQALARYLNVPIVAVTSGFLASIYIAARGKFKIEVRKNYFEAFTEYFIVVMPSGSKKSGIVQSYKTVFDKNIEIIQAEFDKKAPNKKLILQLYKKTEEKLLKDLMKEVTVDNIVEVDRQLKKVEEALEPLKKKLERIRARPNMFNDFPTMKKLAENMKLQNEVLAIFDAEAGLWKSRVRANEDIILLKAYTMESFGNETSTNGSVTMKAPCLVICSYIQPEVAFKLYSKEALKDDGLLPRILPLFCISEPFLWNPVPPDLSPELMAIYEKKITSILEYCSTGNSQSNGRLIQTLKLNEAAYMEYLNFSQKITSQKNDGKFKNCEAFASKLPGHAVRLAGAVHFLQHEKPWEKPIDASAMRAGIALSEFYAEHAMFAFDKKQNDSVVYARKILKWVKRHRKAIFEQREAQRGVGHCKIVQIEAGIDLLQKNNYLAQHINYKGKMLYIVNQNTFREEN